MNLNVLENSVRIITMQLAGRVDAFNVSQFTERAEQLTDAGDSRFVVDLTEVEFLDSAGIAALVSLLKASRQNGGDVKLVWPRLNDAQRILRLTKFDKVFEMLDNAEMAVAF